MPAPGWACVGSEQGIGCVEWDTPCPYSGALAEDGTVRGWIWCVDKVRPQQGRVPPVVGTAARRARSAHYNNVGMQCPCTSAEKLLQ